MSNKKIQDMTNGSPIKLILRFGIPLLIGMLFQQLYSMVDAMIVGQILGKDALAAVGGTGSINFMIIGFCMGVCNGFAIPVAQAVGAKNEHAMRKFVANSVWLSIIFATISTIVVGVLCRDILVWMRTPEDIIDGSYEYIFVIFMGIPVIYLYNLLSGILRSLGDSKTPLYCLILSSFLNIGFDLFSIIVLGMGVSGAAWATVLSQAISGVCCLIYIIKKYPVLKISKDEWKPDKTSIIKLCSMGIPMGLQYSITAIGSVILQSAVNSLGSIAVASMAAGYKINMLFCCPFDALGSTMATYSGQNRGAHRLDRVTKGVLACALIAFIYSLIVFIPLFGFGDKLILIFVKKKEVEVIRNAALLIKYLVSCYIFLALVNIVRFSIQGMGFGTLAIFAGVFEMIARGVVGFALVPRFGFTAACMASPCAWIMADMFLIPAHIYVVRKLKKQFAAAQVN